MKKTFKRIGILALLISATFGCALLTYLIVLFAGDYVIEKEDLIFDTATEIVTEEGKVVEKLYFKNRELVDIKEIPDHVEQAFIAVEDSRFYEHHGIDLQAVLRALYVDLLAGEKRQGGSTITQQLAKRVFLTSEKTWLRKTKEAIIAINLERMYSKKKILEMYLNQIYFGNGAYGIQAAAKLYFNKDVQELTVSEGALLAAILKAPSYYDPLDHPERAKQRRNLILSLMAEQGWISAEKAVRAKGKTLALDVTQPKKHRAYWTYIDMVLKEAKVRYHLSNEEVYTGGYKIVVPMNPKAQKISYQLLQKDRFFPGSNQTKEPEAAFVLLDAETGAVLAIQGGRDYVRKGLNRAVIPRQPGSTFKPLAVYAPALETGQYRPYSLLVDKKLTYEAFGSYTPENYSGQYRGKMTMYDAVRVSANAPAVWLLHEIGIKTAKKYLRKMDIHLPDNGLAIALGGLKYGVSPLQMAAAYRTFADGGMYTEPYFISKIYDRHGRLIASHDLQEKRIFSRQTAWYMTEMLRAVVENGTAREGQIATALAGKTGTTSFPEMLGAVKDAWFVGYTPEVVGSVWIGYGRTTKSQYLTGGSRYPTLLFKAVLKKLPKQLHLAFHKPKGVRDLEKPIRMKKIETVLASWTMHGFLPAIRLQWQPVQKRVEYWIYEVQKNGKMKRIGKVKGKGSFVVSDINPFSAETFVVIPYNPQTKQKGAASRPVTVQTWLDWFS